MFRPSIIDNQVPVGRAVMDADPDSLDGLADYLADLSGLFRRLAHAGRLERERRAEFNTKQDLWWNALNTASQMVVGGYQPEAAAAMCAEEFGQNAKNLLTALYHTGIKNTRQAQFKRDFLIYQMHLADMNYSQIKAAMHNGVSKATISRAIRKFTEDAAGTT